MSNHSAADASYIDPMARREYVFAWLIGLGYSTTQNFSPVLAIVFQQSGFELPAIGLLLSLFAIPTLTATLLSSAAAARFGVLPAARLSIVLTAIGMGSLAFTRNDFATALASRLFQGVGVGLFLPVMMLYVQSRLTRVNFIHLVTIFTVTLPLASAIAPPLGEWTLRHFGATTMFVVAVAPAILALGLSFLLRPSAAAAPASGLNLAGGFRRRFVLPLVSILVGGALYGYVLSYLPADLQARGVPLAVYFLPSTAALLLTRFLGMKRLQHFGPRILVAGGMLLQALGYVIIAPTNNWLVAALAGALLGAGNSFMWPIVSAWLSEGLEAAERAAPQAVGSTVFYSGLYVVPLPLTYLIAHFGYAATEWVLAALALVMMLALLAPRRTHSAAR